MTRRSQRLDKLIGSASVVGHDRPAKALTWLLRGPCRGIASTSLPVACSTLAATASHGERVSAYRVLALYYRFTSEVDHDRFENATPNAGHLGEFRYELGSGTLRAVPFEEFRDREAARDAIEPYLRDWEQSAYLAPAAHRIHFEYERSDVEEIHPKPGNVTVFLEAAMGFGTAFGAVVITRENAAYPLPDPSFRRTPLTDRLVERLRRVRDREAELPAVAYLVLDTIEDEFGGARRKRASAAKALAVDEDVLNKLGALSSRADPTIGRKGGGDRTPLTSSETSWMDAVVTRLVRRIGEHATGGSLSQIGLNAFPPLT